MFALLPLFLCFVSAILTVMRFINGDIVEGIYYLLSGAFWWIFCAAPCGCDDMCDYMNDEGAVWYDDRQDREGSQRVSDAKDGQDVKGGQKGNDR